MDVEDASSAVVFKTVRLTIGAYCTADGSVKMINISLRFKSLYQYTCKKQNLVD
jgi:hypothetical protein